MQMENTTVPDMTQVEISLDQVVETLFDLANIMERILLQLEAIHKLLENPNTK